MNAVLDRSYPQISGIGFPSVPVVFMHSEAGSGGASKEPLPKSFVALPGGLSRKASATSQLRIGVDVDGVLARFEGGFINALRQVSRRRLVPPDYEPETWDWPEAVGYTAAEITAAWNLIKIDPFFWYSLPVLPEAPTFLSALADSPHDVYFITHRMGVRAKRQTEMWLAPYFKRPTVLLVQAKHFAAAALNLDCYIDDKLDNCVDVAGYCDRTRVYMPRRAYNYTEAEIGGVTQIGSILEMLDWERIDFPLMTKAA